MLTQSVVAVGELDDPERDQKPGVSKLDPASEQALQVIRTELAKAPPSHRRQLTEAFVLAVLGSIPWVGAVISAAAGMRTASADARRDRLQTQWLEEHSRKIARLLATLDEITQRFHTLGEAIDERIQSEEYLVLVRRAFRAWDRADTEQKRMYVRNLVANAAGSRVCADDVVRLFIDWLDLYHEAHFAVIREVFDNPGVTRFEIWSTLYGATPREDSAEADLFRLLIRDLSTGGVVRQARDTNEIGQFVRKRARRLPRRAVAATTLESAFEDSKPYVLTSLGRQFVHYTMTDLVPRIGDTI